MCGRCRRPNALKLWKTIVDMASNCRFCKTELTATVVDLGLSPVSNEFRDAATADEKPQTFYPLKAMVCQSCWLVQLSEVETPEHFDADYAYFSSFSTSWLEHAKTYASRMTDMLGLDGASRVVEIASNDGYLLQYFKQAGIPVLGVEPSGNVAEHARAEHGIDTVEAFFGQQTATELVSKGITADLIAANNVLAHVPDINDFVSGFAVLLKPGGTITFEFPHLLNMMRLCQFDTIYHEHFSYLSLGAVERVLAAHGLEVYGAEEIPTHGGSLRVFAGHKDNCRSDAALAASLQKVRADEADYGLEALATYEDFSRAVARRKTDLLAFLIQASADGKKVLGYGAPAKGNTMLNYCGIGPELLGFTVDMSPHKQNHFLPGVNIPVHAPDQLLADRPDFVLILPWNLRGEIAEQLAEIRGWGGQFVVAIPELEIF